MIRKATVEDIPLIIQMAEIVFPHTYSNILSADQIEYMMDMMYSVQSLQKQFTQEHQIFFISESNGYVSYRPDGVLPDGRNLFHLEKLYVLPQTQRIGLGKALFNTVVNDIRASSGVPARIELNVNRWNPAVSFYEHLGMKCDRSGDFPIGNGYYMNDYIMVRDVD